MPRFLINMANHSEDGQRSLEDPIGIVAHQLRALGHDAVWEPSNKQLYIGPDHWNIMVEGFTPHTTEFMKESYEAGARFIILATEEPTPYGFNEGTDPVRLSQLIKDARERGETFSHLDKELKHAFSKEMVMRQRWFPAAAKYADAILHLVPGQHVHDWYSQWAPTAYAELGYAPSLVRFDATQKPEFEFGFYGSMTQRREKLLKKLAYNNKHPTNAKQVRLMCDFKSQEERDKAMREARVIVQVRKADKMGLVSSSRCATALFIGRPVLCEPHELSKPWDEIVKFSKSLDSFFTDAMMMKIGWEQAHARQFKAFQEKLTPDFCIGEPLRKVGILPPKNPIVVQSAA